MNNRRKSFLGLLGAAVFIASAVYAEMKPSDAFLRESFDKGVRYTQRFDFPNRVGSLGDPVSGQAQFGIAADGTSPDASHALFEGVSSIAGTVVGNGRTCFSCHRPERRFGLPPTPLSSTVPLTDALFTGLVADTGDEPLGLTNFENLGLLFHRANRFNPLLPPNDPFRKVFFWRKTQALVNVVFTFGNLNDGRMRELTEAARGAIFTHTQDTDLRFDDLAPLQSLRDISAFMEAQVDPPQLAALLDPEDPLHDTLVNDPFYTVRITTAAEARGRALFRRNCMPCHNVPNVFGNIDHVDGKPLSFPPHYGHIMDIGVSQRNKHNLEFRDFDSDLHQRVPIVLPLVKVDGTIVQHMVTDDVGVAGTTGRYEDLHRFKVPQLRGIKHLAPYFHDNSADTLEEVVDYFDSPSYNQSADGSQNPIHLNADQKADLIAFLKCL